MPDRTGGPLREAPLCPYNNCRRRMGVFGLHAAHGCGGATSFKHRHDLTRDSLAVGLEADLCGVAVVEVEPNLNLCPHRFGGARTDAPTVGCYADFVVTAANSNYVAVDLVFAHPALPKSLVAPPTLGGGAAGKEAAKRKQYAMHFRDLKKFKTLAIEVGGYIGKEGQALLLELTSFAKPGTKAHAAHSGRVHSVLRDLQVRISCCLWRTTGSSIVAMHGKLLLSGRFGQRFLTSSESGLKRLVPAAGAADPALALMALDAVSLATCAGGVAVAA